MFFQHSVKRDPVHFPSSPITWAVAITLAFSAFTAASMFLRTDLGPPQRVESPEKTNSFAPGVLSPDSPTVLVVAVGQNVQMETFSSMEKCSEAATYIQIGTDRRATAQCVTK